MLQFDALLFDLGNVIIDLDIEATPRALQKLIRDDVSPDEARREFQRLEWRFEIGSISEDAFINGILKWADRDAQALDVVNAWNAMLLRIPQRRLDLLEYLNQDIPVYILSNTNTLHLRWVKQTLNSAAGVSGFAPRFARKAYYSCELGMRKPEQNIFKYILADTGLTPEKVLYLDDTVEHIGAALEMGFLAAQLPREEEWTDRMKGLDLSLP